MTRYKTRKRKPSQKKVKVQTKPLNEKLWIKNTNEITALRDAILEANGDICEMTKEKVKRPSLDHCHDTGEVRGVISQHCNTMEGYVLKYFKKYVQRHSQLSLPEWLRSLATYYETDFMRGLHFRTLHDAQVRLSNMTKDSIINKAEYDFDLELEMSMTKDEMIELYSNKLITNLEEQYQEYVDSLPEGTHVSNSN